MRDLKHILRTKIHLCMFVSIPAIHSKVFLHGYAACEAQQANRQRKLMVGTLKGIHSTEGTLVWEEMTQDLLESADYMISQ